MSLFRAGGPWFLVVAVAVTPAVAWAGPDGDDEPDQALEPMEESDRIREHAQLLYDRGKTKFEAAQYHEAMDLWTRAYAILPETAEYSRLKVFVLYDLVAALERAYEVERDPQLPQRARRLLLQRRQWLDDNTGRVETFEQERARVEGRLNDIEARIEDEPDESVKAPLHEAVSKDTSAPAVTSQRRVRALIGTGSFGLTVGAAGVACLVIGLVRREATEGVTPPRPVDEALAYTGGVVAGIGLVAGAVLLTVGIREKRWLRVAFAPWGDPTGAGASVALAF